MSTLAREDAAPIKGIVPPLKDQQIEDLRKDIFYWEIIEQDECKHLSRDFKFANFREAVEFVNQVADLAEQQDHHPLLVLDYKNVTLSWSTHAVKGLHRNDFIMAAKSEEIYNRWDTVTGKKDAVQLASEQSFPASDPPGRNDQME